MFVSQILLHQWNVKKVPRCFLWNDKFWASVLCRVPLCLASWYFVSALLHTLLCQHSRSVTHLNPLSSEVFAGIVQFLKSKPFNRKFREFWDENRMEQQLPKKIFWKLGCTSGGCPLLRKIMYIHNFLLSASSLAAITSSRTSQTKMKAKHIPKWSKY